MCQLELRLGGRGLNPRFPRLAPSGIFCYGTERIRLWDHLELWGRQPHAATLISGSKHRIDRLSSHVSEIPHALCALELTHVQDFIERFVRRPLPSSNRPHHSHPRKCRLSLMICTKCARSYSAEQLGGVDTDASATLPTSAKFSSFVGSIDGLLTVVNVYGLQHWRSHLDAAAEIALAQGRDVRVEADLGELCEVFPANILAILTRIKRQQLWGDHSQGERVATIHLFICLYDARWYKVRWYHARWHNVHWYEAR